MSAAFAKVFHQAEKTFSILNKESLKANLLILKKLVDTLKLSDIDADFPKNRVFHRRNEAPCSFINLCEKENFTMSVFIIHKGYTMPLHDHPGMFGLLKVVSGTLEIRSYSRVPNSCEEIVVQPEDPKTLNEASAASFLDEKVCNFHEISAVDGPAAFFDVLSPPYSDLNDDSPESRHCHFYRKLLIDDSHDKAKLKLELIDCPSHYYCESIKYRKPEFIG